MTRTIEYMILESTDELHNTVMKVTPDFQLVTVDYINSAVENLKKKIRKLKPDEEIFIRITAGSTD